MKNITIDHREQAEPLCQSLTGSYGFSIKHAQLDIGDYHLAPGTYIERKTTHDFAHSLIDGRLFRQAFRLAELTDNPLMIIEGKTFRDCGLRIQAVRGALITLAQTHRLPVLRTVDQLDTAWHLNALYEHQGRIGANPGVRKGPKHKRIEYQKQAILASLPGIGEKTAATLLDEFGSIHNVIKADLDELSSVPGVGRKRAARILEVVREVDEPYGEFEEPCIP